MNNYIYTIFLTFLLSFNNFNHEDWLSVIKPQNILSITEDSFELHFLSENGIFSYNFLEDIIYYNESFSYKLPKKGIMLHYNKSNDFLARSNWIVNGANSYSCSVFSDTEYKDIAFAEDSIFNKDLTIKYKKTIFLDLKLVDITSSRSWRN